MSHDALKRLGVFSVGDKVTYAADNPYDQEEGAVVVTIGTHRDGCVEIRLDDPQRNYRLVEKLWVTKAELRHRFT